MFSLPSATQHGHQNAINIATTPSTAYMLPNDLQNCTKSSDMTTLQQIVPPVQPAQHFKSLFRDPFPPASDSRNLSTAPSFRPAAQRLPQLDASAEMAIIFSRYFLLRHNLAQVNFNQEA